MKEEFLETEDGILVEITEEIEVDGEKLNNVFVRGNRFDILDSEIEDAQEVLEFYEKENYPRLSIFSVAWTLNSNNTVGDYTNEELLESLMEQEDEVYAKFIKCLVGENINMNEIRNKIQEVRDVTELVTTGDINNDNL